jgi:hypothetical protein
MAISSSEFRQLLKDVQSLTKQSRETGNSNASIQQQLENLLPKLREAESEGYVDASGAISDVNSYIRLISQNLTSAPASAGNVVRDDQGGYGNKSRIQNPSTEANELVLKNGRVQATPESTAGTNALPSPDTPNNTNWGLDSPTRPYSLTQSTTPGTGLQSPGAVYSVGGIKPTTSNGIVGPNSPGGAPGAGAAGDDSGRTNTGTGTRSGTGSGTNDTVSQLNQINFGTVTPQPNILNQYSSYTYQASLYLISSDNYQRMVNTNKKDLSDAQLLVQSGGASPIGRSEYFKLDYYIDDIELDSAFAANGGTRLAHNVTEIDFTVIEPSGISFVQNLDAAVQQFLGGVENKKKNYASQIYLMVIRFYGYDSQGNLVRGGVNNPDPTSDPNAFVEKWYPMNIKHLKFRVASKVVEYQIKAVVTPYYIGGGSARGTIPFNYELSGQTVSDILAGPATYSTSQAAVSAGGNRTSSTGAAPINIKQQNAIAAAAGNRGRGSQAPPTATPIDIKKQNAIAAAAGNRGRGSESIATAAANAATAAAAPPKADAATTVKKTVRQGLMSALNEYQNDLVKKKVVTYPDTYEIEFAIPALASAKITNPGGLNKSATSMSAGGTAADQKLGSKQSMDPNSRVQGATAGMQVVQFIDNLMRNSSYIKDQQVLVKNENTGANESTGINLANTAWYKISFSATQGQYDPKRNDYAYHIKYTISPFKIAQLNSSYFKQPEYTGSHKQYVYWFTGENDAVLSYEENLDHLYYTVVSGAVDPTAVTSSALEILKFQAQTASGQSNQGADNSVNEPGANAADQLYSPSDLGSCNLSIVGDPAWLAQGEAAVGLSTQDQFYFQPFLADGTINFDSQQILFEVGYNTVSDYDIYTGLSNPDRGNLKSLAQIDSNTRGNSPTKISRVYTATKVKSSFKKGKFTQAVNGRLRLYYTPKELADQGRKPAPTTPATQTAKVKTPAPAWNPKDIRSSVTNPTPTTSLAKGTQQILTPATQANNPSLSQLQASPVYIQARRNGATPAAALEAAKSSFAAGTNNAANFAAPGIRTGPQPIVKDQ